MFRSKSTNSTNTDSPEEIIELGEASSSKNHSQSSIAKININSIYFTSESKRERGVNNVMLKQNPSPFAGEKENEDYDTNESTNLIYSYKTLQLPKSSPETMENKAATIAHRIERKNKLMQNDPVSELLRLEMIRNMPQSLTLKRSVKAKVTLSVSQKSKGRKSIGYCKKLQYQTGMLASKIRIAFNQMGSSIEFWYHPIKEIEGHFGSGIATYFKFLRWLLFMNTVSCIVSNLFVTLPQALVHTHQYRDMSLWDFLLGSGIVTNSIFYYGFYYNDTLMINSQFAYDLPSAYFATFMFCYIFTFIILCFKVARSYKKCFIETSGGTYNRYANKIFCSWDWGISSYKAASLRSASIFRELEELLWDAKNSISMISCSMWIFTLLIRVAMTTLILTVLCGTGALLWLLLNLDQENESDAMSIPIVPLAMTFIVNALPPLISWSVKYERYAKDRVAMYMTMVRVYVIAMIAVATLLTFWLTRGMYGGCWQTRLAQEIYRLIIFDFFVSVFVVFAIQGLRSCRPLRQAFGAPQFDIARNTLNLIYNQSLFWLAHYFSPPLSIIVVAKLLVTFYVRKCELLSFCEPPSKFWRAAQTQTLFLALTFLSIISSLMVLGYVLIYADTSSCGPFAGGHYTWEIVVDRVLHVSRDSAFWNALRDIANPGTSIALMIVMCIAVYYLRAKAEASKQMVKILREMLVWQARDKEFLLKTFSSTNDENSLRHRRSSKVLGDSRINDLTDRDRLQVNEPSTSY